MEEFGDLFFVARDVRQKAFELLRHRAKVLALRWSQPTRQPKDCNRRESIFDKPAVFSQRLIKALVDKVIPMVTRPQMPRLMYIPLH